MPLKCTTRFRYLGIEVQRDPKLYLEDNVYTVLQNLITKCQTWKSLPLSLVGRINLLKMTFLSKFLYIFRNTPVPIPNSFFQKVDQTVNSFIWAETTP